ncbi:MAG: EamA family transporter RarD [Ferrimonas sp.]
MSQAQLQQGIGCAIAAYVMWGIAPLYFYAVKAVPSDEILMHRIIWSFGLMLALVLLQRQWGNVRATLKQPKVLGWLLVSALVVASNWLTYIWAVTHGRIIDASLGYYINPLINIAFGTILFREQLGKLSLLAVLLASFGVLVQLFQYGSLPLISLYLASSFAIYGVIRKRLPVPASTGLLIETAWLLPMAVGYWLWLATPTSDFFSNSSSLNALLLASGVVTTLPLLAYGFAARRIPFYLLGMLQYIGPTIMLLMGLWLFGEQMQPEQRITFGFIWAALLLMSLEALWKVRQQRTRQVTQPDLE